MAARIAAEPPSAFGRLLAVHIRRQHRSRIQVSLAAGVDPSYGTRLVHGAWCNPSRTVVESFAEALHLKAAERDQLLAAAGYLPTSERWSWDSPAFTSVAVADALEFLERAATEPDWRRYAQLVAHARVLLERAVGRGDA